MTMSPQVNVPEPTAISLSFPAPPVSVPELIVIYPE